MGVKDREYMDRPFSEVEDEGVVARSREDAERLLQFSCPTLASNGKWYRTTLAVTNVPVVELYNVISNASFIGSRLREIAKQADGDLRKQIEAESLKLESLRDLLRQGIGGGVSPFAGSNIHQPRKVE